MRLLALHILLLLNFIVVAQINNNFKPLHDVPDSSFDVTYDFNSGITAAFSFVDSGDNKKSSLEFGLNLGRSRLTSSFYGKHSDKLSVNLGLDYDYMIQKDSLFTSVGFFVDYVTISSSKLPPSSNSNDGLLLIGLKTTLGL